jgi:hypothetical protein|tara:strand:+ start:55 stop:279 length:225 start_codon:yes stop_codon:yes gene_type:complete
LLSRLLELIPLLRTEPLAAGSASKKQIDGVSGSQVHDEEGDQRNPEHCWYRKKDPLKDVLDHGAAVVRVWPVMC